MMGMIDKKILFLHVPKAAGQTFSSILQNNAPRGNKILDLGANSYQAIENFKALPEEKRESFSGISGHMGFGLHEYFSTDANYLTFLRDPVKRIQSYYGYVLRREDHYLHPKVVKNGKALPFYDFLCSKLTSEIENGQIRLLSSDDGHDNLKETLTEDDYKRAIENFDNHFLIAGIVEKFDESLLLIKKLLGLKKIYYNRSNVALARPEPLDKKSLDEIISMNEFDIRLYERQRKKLESLLINYPNLEAELSSFRRVNAQLNRVKGLVQKTKRVMKKVVS